MSQSDKVQLRQRAQESRERMGEEAHGRQVHRGRQVKQETYSSEICGARKRMWNVDFPPRVGAQPGGCTQVQGTDPFLLLL